MIQTGNSKDDYVKRIHLRDESEPKLKSTGIFFHSFPISSFFLQFSCASVTHVVHLLLFYSVWTSVDFFKPHNVALKGITD